MLRRRICWLTPDDSFMLCHRAQCWIGLKQFDKAIHDADEALRLDSESDFAATVREMAVRGKSDPSSSADPFFIAANEDERSVTVDSVGPFAPSCHIGMQGPAGLEVAFESPSEQFGPQTLRSFPASNGDSN
ncbi:MAG TPA: tetratricopeptide repeat protein [Pirellulales bacterium]|nr:tetratricopeptide repeat protein [Pirellulales bacterium]